MADIWLNKKDFRKYAKMMLSYAKGSLKNLREQVVVNDKEADEIYGNKFDNLVREITEIMNWLEKEINK